MSGFGLEDYRDRFSPLVFLFYISAFAYTFVNIIKFLINLDIIVSFILFFAEAFQEILHT
jgi:hypothetical protein